MLWWAVPSELAAWPLCNRCSAVPPSCFSTSDLTHIKQPADSLANLHFSISAVLLNLIVVMPWWHDFAECDNHISPFLLPLLSVVYGPNCCLTIKNPRTPVVTHGRRLRSSRLMAEAFLLPFPCRSDVPSVVKAAVRQLKEKSVRTRQGVFAALQELVAVASDSIGSHTAQMMPGIQVALNVSPSINRTALDYHYAFGVHISELVEDI